MNILYFMAITILILLTIIIIGLRYIIILNKELKKIKSDIQFLANRIL